MIRNDSEEGKGIMLRRAFEKRSKKGRTLAGLFAAALLAAFAAVGAVTASEADRMPELDAGQKGSLKVTMTYTDPNQETDNRKALSGVEVKLAQVAELSVKGGSAEYALLGTYASSGIDLEGMTASESGEAAARLAGLVPDGSARTATTGSDGTVLFDSLEPGMYLVYQETEANSAYRVDAAAAFLVAVPTPVRGASGSAGNAWDYSVEVYPKTELSGPRNNGVIRVTKELHNSDTDLSYSPPENEEIVFYVGLFSDEACTQQVEGTTDQPLRFLNASSTTAVFENLETDRTYYIAETDGNGNAVPSVLQTVSTGEVLFEAQYPNGQTVTITREQPEGEIQFLNATLDLPDGFYYSGTLTITKKTMMDGMEYETDDTFYAVVFSDPDHKTPYSDVIELSMDGKSSVSVPLSISIGLSENDSATYYVAETDQDGNPLDGTGQEFTISISSPDGKVTLSPQDSEKEVTITNHFTEEEETEITKTTTSSGSGGGTPRTGDETPIFQYVAAMAAAFLVMAAAAAVAVRRRKR
mgnify:CR=1 FL=1